MPNGRCHLNRHEAGQTIRGLVAILLFAALLLSARAPQRAPDLTGRGQRWLAAPLSVPERNHIPETLGGHCCKRVLAVGESDHFAELGGTIGFVIEDERIRFTVNVDAAQRADLKISSKVLALARIVRDDPPPAEKLKCAG